MTRYIDWKMIGEGAFAEVFRVYDQKLECQVAIKLLKQQHKNHPEYKKMLRGLHKEVWISRQLREHHITPIHDLYDGERGAGIVMDFIQGIELKDWMRQNRNRLLETATDRLDLFKKLAEALKVAHTLIIHRDVKPANIFLIGGKLSQPVMMDFGVSVVGMVADGEQNIVGTPKYMAPEQVTCPGKVDRRCDLFALGLLGYELFTNKIPATSLRTFFSKNHTGPRVPPRIPLEQIAPPSDFCATVPPALDHLIIQLMAYDPDERPASASDVSELLAGIVLQEIDYHKIGARQTHPQTKKLLVHGGEFKLGSGTGSKQANEKPIRRVQISDFFMDVHPVTNRAYKMFVDATGYQPAQMMDDPHFGADDHPVVAVSWADAEAYAQWMGGMLPSEAQWEYAAKNGSNNTYPWGEELPTTLHANIEYAYEVTTRVGSYPKGNSEIGLQDLCGNVWEWCCDIWRDDYYRTLEHGCVDPVYNNGKGEERSLRGGSYNSMAVSGRCGFRFHAAKGEKNAAIGFRVIYPADKSD